MCPIVGNLYTLAPAEDYDLCEAEWAKLEMAAGGFWNRVVDMPSCRATRPFVPAAIKTDPAALSATC